MKCPVLQRSLEEAARLGLPVVELYSPQPYLTTAASTVIHASPECPSLTGLPTSSAMLIPAEVLTSQYCSQCPVELPPNARHEHRLLDSVLDVEWSLRKEAGAAGATSRRSRSSFACPATTTWAFLFRRSRRRNDEESQRSENTRFAHSVATLQLVADECPTTVVSAFGPSVESCISRARARVNTFTGGALDGPLTYAVALPRFSRQDHGYGLTNQRSVVAGVGHYVSDSTARAGFALVTDAGRAYVEQGELPPTFVALQPGDTQALPVALSFLAADPSFAAVNDRREATMIQALAIARLVTAPLAV